MNILRQFQEVIQTHSHRVALRIENAEVSYLQLGNQINYAAELIKLQGIASQEVVAIISENVPDFAAITLAVWRVGGIVLLIDASRPIKQIEYMLLAANAKVAIIVSSSFQHLLSIPSFSIDFSNATISKKLELYETESELAYICFTSGTTGQPKGILVSHASLSHFLNWQKDTFAINETDKCLQLTKLSFDVVYRSVFTGLLSGATIVFPSLDMNIISEDGLALIKSQQITYLHIVPSILKQILLPLTKALKLPELRYVFSAGEKLERSLVEKLRKLLIAPNLSVVNLYGPSETVLAKFFYVVPESLGTEFILPVGQAIPNTQFILVADGEVIDRPEVSAEIIIVSDYTSEGYIDKMVAFRAIPGSSLLGYYTGDLGYYKVQPTGQKVLYVQGRLDEQIKINGVRIELTEIDFAVSSLEYIQSAATVYDNISGKLICYVIPQGELTLKKLYLDLVNYLIPEMLPHSFMLVDRLLYNNNGKLDRRNLHTLAGKLLEVDRFFNIENRALTNRLRNIWQDLFNKAKIEDNASFYSEGGNSLLAAVLAVQIKKHLLVKISLKEVLKHNTLLEQANFINGLVKTTVTESMQHNLLTDQLIPEQASFATYQILNPQAVENNIGYLFKFTDIKNISKFKNKIELFLRQVPMANWKITVQENLRFVQKSDLALVQEVVLSHPEDLDLTANLLFATPIDITKSLVEVYLLHCLSLTGLFVKFHHCISDGESSLQFFHALSGFFKANEQTQQINQVLINKLPPISNSSFKFWSTYLDTYTRPEPFYDLSSNVQQLRKGELFITTLDSADFSQVTSLCKEKDKSEFVILLTLFSYVLMRFNRSANILIGVPVSNRAVYAAENCLGCYVKTLPIILTLDPNQSLAETLERFQLLIIELLDNQFNTSLPELIKELASHKNINNFELVDMFFSYDNYYLDTVELDGFVGQRGNLINHSLKFPFSFMLNKMNNGSLRIEAEYDTTKFSSEIVKTFITSFKYLVSQLPQIYLQPLKSISYAKNTDGILYGSSYDFGNEDIYAYLFRHIVAKPQAVALFVDGQEYTYQELWNYAEQICLQLDGLQPGEVVIALLPRSFKLFASLIAIWKKNLVYLPIDPSTPKERIKLIIEDANPKIIISESEDFPSSTKLVNFRDIDKNKNMPLNSQRPVIKLDSPAYLLYTSGTSGKPKGVLQTHQTLLNLCSYKHRSLKLPKQDLTIAQFAAQGFDVSIQTISYALIYGAKLVVISDEEKLQPRLLWGIISKFKIRMIVFPPAVLQLMAEHYQQTLPLQLNCILTSGEALVITKQIRQLFALIKPTVLVNQYGPTETHVITQNILVTDPENWESLPSIGTLLDNCGALILDDDHNLVPHGVIGELYLFGVNLACGYVNNKSQTDKVFLTLTINNKPVRVYKTGDLVRIKDGQIYYNGRSDQQINLNGFRIEPEDIGKVLAKHHNIKQTFIVSSLVAGSPVLVAYYTSIDAKTISEDDLQQLIQEHLPSYMHVSYFMHLEKFPLTTNMKIDKRALPPIQQLISVSTTDNADYSDVQRRLLNIINEASKSSYCLATWQSLLKLGFNSLTIARILAGINSEFGIELAFNEFYNYHNLLLLSNLIEQKQNGYANAEVKTTRNNIYYPSKQQYRILNDLSNGQNQLANNLYFVLEFTGNVNCTKLLTAINQTLENHDIFKTVYDLLPNTEGILAGMFKVKNKVLHYAAIKKTVVPINKVITQALNSSFYPFNNGLYDICLYSNNNKQAVLILTINHLIFDGTSAQLFFNEIQNRYNDNFVKQLSLTYGEVSNYVTNTQNRENKAYLNSILSKIDNLISLPVESSIEIGNNLKSSRWITIDSSILNGLMRVSMFSACSLFSLLAYGLGKAIRKYTKSNSLIGVTVSGRNANNINVLGLFSQRTVIDVQGLIFEEQTQTILEDLTLLQKNVFNALSNPLLSIYDDEKHLLLKQDKNLATPQFNLVFQNYEKNTLSFQDLQCTFLPIQNKYYSLDVTDITCVIDELPNFLQLEIVYNENIYTDGFIFEFTNSLIDNLKKLASLKE